MTDSNAGKIGWTDLTVPNADRIRDFYSEVAGWEAKPVDMGDYADYCMHRPEEESPVAGICHARGINADLPAQWMIYITVADLKAALDKVAANGGEVLQQRLANSGDNFNEDNSAVDGPYGQGSLAIIRDPSGAVAALYQG